MSKDIARADQSGLDDIEDHPCGKDDGMDREKQWLGMARVEEPLVDRLAEPVNHDGSNQKRHEEVKVLAQQSGELGWQCDFLDWVVICSASLTGDESGTDATAQ
jgi:hypothetical protein